MNLHDAPAEGLLSNGPRHLQASRENRPVEADDGEVQEFRRKKLLPLYAVIAAVIMAGVATAFAELLLKGTVSLAPIVGAVVAAALGGVLQSLVFTGKYRVLLAEDGLLVEDGHRKQMAAWGHVRAAVLVFVGRRLVLHVGQAKPITVDFRWLDRAKAARQAIESRLPTGVVMEDRRDIYGEAANAAIGAGCFAVIFCGIALGLLWRAVGVWACAAGVLTAVYVYAAHVRRHAPSGGRRMWICMAWSGGALAASVAAAAIWAALTNRPMDKVLPAMLVFAVVFGFVLILTQLVATIRYNAALLRDVMRPLEAAPPTSG